MEPIQSSKKPPASCDGFDCLKCGACCCSIYDQDVFCDMTEEECKAFSLQFRTKNIKEFDLFAIVAEGAPPYALRTKFVKSKEGIAICACCQLDGSPMHKVKCRIYDSRPYTCRESVKPGDKSCRQLRRIVQRKIKQGKRQ